MRGADAGDPGEVVATVGPAVEEASAAMILVHGRGGTAQGMLELWAALDLPTVAALAPQAAGNEWYPESFLAPIERNEPELTAAFAVLDRLVERLEASRIPSDRTILAGFSQGACLALEYVARHPRRYGGVAGLSGGLIGPPGTPRDYPGSLAGTAVFLGCGEPDPHIPRERVDETAEVLGRMGAAVEERIYPGLGHTVGADEIARVRRMAQGLRI